MAQRVSGIKLTATFTMGGATYRDGKLFLGLLGFEYPFGDMKDLLSGGVISKNIEDFDASGKPQAGLLEYNYINRTSDQDEYAFSDGVLPVYIRFQPDLREPLIAASQQDPTAGINYELQAVTIDNPVVEVSGQIAYRDAVGVTKYLEQTVKFVIPVNPEQQRNVTLSVQQGLFVFLAKAR